MLTTRPSTSLLEQALFTYLTSDRNTATQTIASTATITPTHPNKPSDLTGGKGAIVVQAINDSRMGRSITPWLSSPGLQFACYADSYGRSKQLQELAIEALTLWSGEDLAMEGQRVQNGFPIAPIAGSNFDNASGLFVSVVGWRFNLSKR